MKTLSKKLLTGCMALAMACAMAIPTFAAEPAVSPGRLIPTPLMRFNRTKTGSFFRLLLVRPFCPARFLIGLRVDTAPSPNCSMATAPVPPVWLPPTTRVP